MIECSGFFEALRPEEGGRDFDRRLLLMFPEPPLPEDDFDILGEEQIPRTISDSPQSSTLHDVCALVLRDETQILCVG